MPTNSPDKDINWFLANAGFENALAEEIIAYGRAKNVSANTLVASPDSHTNEMPFVLSGTLKVMRQDAQGNEIFLYYLDGGETCAMSITCCLEGKSNSIHVIAEEDAKLWMVPNSYLDSWIVKYVSFRKFVFQSYQCRFDEMLNTIDSIAFMKLDERLYNYLLDKKQSSGTYIINKTHQQIANEMNTSRVVVSRLLKNLEKEEKIEQGRNRIEIL